MDEEGTKGLVQAAIENRWSAKHNLRFFLHEIENIVIGPETLIRTATKGQEPAVLLKFLLDYGVNMQITQEVLQAVAGSIDDDSSVMRLLLERNDKIELTDEIFKAAAASGSRMTLEVLSNHRGMAEIPRRWLDLACLWDGVHSGSSDSSYVHFPRPSGGDLDLDVVMELLDQGVEPDVQDGDGLTPLFHAAVSGNIRTVRALLSAGAKRGATPMFFVAWGGHYAVVEMLLDLGVPSHLEDEHGQTPASIAKNHGHIKVFKLLERRRQP